MLKFKIVLAFFFFLFSSSLFAQFPTLPSNLSTYRSSDVSDEQLTQIADYVKQNNIAEQQVFDLLVSRGMPLSEATLLRTRLHAKLLTPTSETNKNKREDDLKDEKTKTDRPEKRYTDSLAKYKPAENPLKIFGLEIFNNGVLSSFEPDLKIATPAGYIIGPEDELVINIYGYSEQNYKLTVSPEGSVNVPYIGIIYVAGLTVEQATAKIKSKLASSGYGNLRTGLTKLNVSVGRIRSIKVTVLGEVKKPGSFTLPSLATAFNALYASGGPNNIGSMRNIEIIRNGKIIEKLDIYDFLIKGDQTANIQLRDQDVLRIPPYNVRVSMEGQVKRTGLFEIKNGETFSDLLQFAGGFSDSAYTASVTAYKLTDTEKKIIDISKEQYGTYSPSRSESFVVKKLIDRFTNRVTISGAVYLPGDFQLVEGMTVRDLIKKAQGLTQDAYKERAIIERKRADLSLEYLSFNPLRIMDDTASAIYLKNNDKVVISFVSNLREKNSVWIYGEVRHAGPYPYVENMSLKDLILVAGGFTDAAIPQRIEVSRRLKKDSFNLNDVEIAKVLDVTSIKDLEKNTNDILLNPYDLVIVRRNPGFREQINVNVQGEVVFPGAYTLSSKVERISDVIRRAGGLTNQAYEQGGYLSRLNNPNVINSVNKEKVSKIQEQLKDSTDQVVEEVSRPVDQIALNLNSILANPGGKEDLVLENGDIINIPKAKMEVRISGEVLFPTRVVYQEDMDLKDYIGRAGGFTDNARKARVYVLYPNGNAAKTGSFLFFRSYPKVTPGSEIIVPKAPYVERRRLSTGEVIGITTALTSFAGVLLSVIINSK